MLIHCQALGDNEFCLEVFEVGIIEAELTLQSAIGDTATVAEQLNDLIDDLVKVHASPPCVSSGHVAVHGSAYQNRGLISSAPTPLRSPRRSGPPVLRATPPTR